MGCGTETKDLIQEDQKGCIRGCEEFKYLGIKIEKGDSQENDIKNRINKGRPTTAMLKSVLWNRQKTRKKQITYIRMSHLYGPIWELQPYGVNYRKI